MPDKISTIIFLNLLVFSCLIAEGTSAQSLPKQRSKTVASQPQAKTENLDLFDNTRNRSIPVTLYLPVAEMNVTRAKNTKLKFAILSHGYGMKNTEYSFIANNLAARGYLVASIQHELPGDEPPATTGKLSETRRPNWERGVQNILFVIQELRRLKPHLDFEHLLLIGHSNGGDMTMLFAEEHSKLVSKVITLDNRRMPFPRTKNPRILSLRSSDQTADAGVLPSAPEQKKFGIKIIKLEDTKHNDMWDGATEKQKREINKIISSFLSQT
jgi:predicted dienelactone hydrolase